MFGIKKELLVKNLCKLVASRCVYSKQPCDCKYMIHDDDNVSQFSEIGNGCPETTMAATLIANMTEQEFNSIARRAGITISDSTEPAIDVFKMIGEFQEKRHAVKIAAVDPLSKNAKKAK